VRISTAHRFASALHFIGANADFGLRGGNGVHKFTYINQQRLQFPLPRNVCLPCVSQHPSRLHNPFRHGLACESRRPCGNARYASERISMSREEVRWNSAPHTRGAAIQSIGFGSRRRHQFCGVCRRACRIRMMKRLASLRCSARITGMRSSTMVLIFVRDLEIIGRRERLLAQVMKRKSRHPMAARGTRNVVPSRQEFARLLRGRW